jgi:hypothetical protein
MKIKPKKNLKLNGLLQLIKQSHKSSKAKTLKSRSVSLSNRRDPMLLKIHHRVTEFTEIGKR